MLPVGTLALFDSQVRQSTRPDLSGAIVESDAAIVRWLAPDGQGASCVTWSRLDARTADAAIAAQIEFFRRRREQFEWKLYDYDQPADLAERLLAAGFLADAEEAVMVTEPARLTAAGPLPGGVTLRQVSDQAGAGLLVDVHERVFGAAEPRLRRSLADRLMHAPDSIGLVIAFAGDEPVGAGRIEFPDGSDFASMWGGGTMPSWRGQGIYAALVACRVRLAAERGYRYVQVDALPTSQPILTRLGFAALARSTPYIWDPGVAPDTLRVWLPVPGRGSRYLREVACGRAEVARRDRCDARRGQGRRRRARRRPRAGGHRSPPRCP